MLKKLTLCVLDKIKQNKDWGMSLHATPTAVKLTVFPYSKQLLTSQMLPDTMAMDM